MPAPGFQTDEQLQDQVKAVLSVNAFDAGSGWPLLCQRANATAYSSILQAFLRRGYTAAQADGWDDGATFQADLGLYYAIVRGGLAKDYDPKFLALLDRRPELRTAPLTVGGVPVAPAIASVGAGVADESGSDFTLADADLQDWYGVGEGPPRSPPPRR